MSSNYAQNSNAYHHKDSLESDHNLDPTPLKKRMTVNVTTYHKRRQETGYLVGFEDLEESLQNDISRNFKMIHGNNEGLM